MHPSVRDEPLYCVRCSYEWMPRKKELPRRCPNCRSVKWNEANLRVTCLRCDHTWNSHDGNPRRCPRCGSHQWNVPPKTFTCKRCGKVWESKGNRVPQRCPSCFSKKWNVDREPDEPSETVPHADDVMREAILDAYRRGNGCVSIAIELDIPFGIVRDVVFQDSPGAPPRP